MRVLIYMRQWKGIMKEAVDRTAITVKFLCVLHVINNYICSPTHVHGPSMLPILNLTGDVLLAEHVYPRLGKLGPGDLVLVRSPLNPNRTMTKRIVGMEGDRITYFDPRHGDIAQTVVVSKGHVWIQGDNIYASRDSRDFGPVPYGLIQGKVFFRIFSEEEIHTESSSITNSVNELMFSDKSALNFPQMELTEIVVKVDVSRRKQVKEHSSISATMGACYWQTKLATIKC